MYKVVRYFEDAQDGNHAYNVGDIFPHKGMTVSQQRINDLMSGNNFQQVQLIALDTDAKADTPKDKPEKVSTEEPKKDESTLTVEDINKLPFFKLKSLAKSKGIDVEDKKADALRAEMIERI